jgi:hypothetical protein
VHFLPIICKRFFASGSDRDLTIQALADSLADCYRFAEKPGPELSRASRRFANAYSALEASELQKNAASAHWRIKPKLHLFQELCEFGKRSPRLFWCYMDETFGNVCAKLAVRRGGADNPGKNVEGILNGWCCGTKLPNPY